MLDKIAEIKEAHPLAASMFFVAGAISLFTTYARYCNKEESKIQDGAAGCASLPENNPKNTTISLGTTTATAAATIATTSSNSNLVQCFVLHRPAVLRIDAGGCTSEHGCCLVLRNGVLTSNREFQITATDSEVRIQIRKVDDNEVPPSPTSPSHNKAYHNVVKIRGIFSAIHCSGGSLRFDVENMNMLNRFQVVAGNSSLIHLPSKSFFEELHVLASGAAKVAVLSPPNNNNNKTTSTVVTAKVVTLKAIANGSISGVQALQSCDAVCSGCARIDITGDTSTLRVTGSRSSSASFTINKP